MLIACLVLICIVGLISFYFRLKAFNNLSNVQKEAYYCFKQIKNGSSLKELNSLLGRKGRKVFCKNKYRWTFGDTIIVKKGNEVISFEDFSNATDDIHNYSFKISPAYIEMESREGTFYNAVAVGLN